MKNFSKMPVIVEGVNHSGTRLLVEILTIFGSDGGDCNNNWKENKFFLELHNQLINKISNKGWTQTILSIDFISKYEDKLEHKSLIQNKLDNELGSHFTNYKSKLWHWKCPTSALFEKTWTEIYPDAYYIINRRDPAKIAKAFLRRRGGASLSFKDGLRFYHIMEGKIFSVEKKNQLVIDFDNLEREIPRIIEFLQLKVTQKQIDLAYSKINYKNHTWNPNWSLRLNLKNNWAKMIYKLYKKEIIYKEFNPEYDR